MRALCGVTGTSVVPARGVGFQPMFFETNLFCFLTGNADMQLKNFSLLRSSEGGMEFSPAYDLLPTVLLLPEDIEETALTLNGKKKKLGPGDFKAFGAALKLTERQMLNAIKRFEKNVNAATKLVGQGLCSSEMKDRYRKLLSDRWARLKDSKSAA